MIIKTADSQAIMPFIKQFSLPAADSHKGQNGKVLIIGGSGLFHSASLWAAEIASHFADMVHYSSTEENNEIFTSLKKIFRNGIVVSQKQLLNYLQEDNAILVGPGMVRAIQDQKSKIKNQRFEEIIKIKDEAEYTKSLTEYLISNFPDKKFVFDAGALQMMDPEWLHNLRKTPILTPHQLEFEQLFDIPIRNLSLEEKIEKVKEKARQYHCIILLKATVDIISDGEKDYVIEGGNAGLTKGGSGDVLAGLTLAFRAKNPPLISAILASYTLKKAGEELFVPTGYWYNITDLINQIPRTFRQIAL